LRFLFGVAKVDKIFAFRKYFLAPFSRDQFKFKKGFGRGEIYRRIPAIRLGTSPFRLQSTAMALSFETMPLSLMTTPLSLKTTPLFFEYLAPPGSSGRGI
jgi:hypothetical protein